MVSDLCRLVIPKMCDDLLGFQENRSNNFTYL